MDNLYPTGTCFDDAIDYLNWLCTQEPWNIKKFNKKYRVVHGICHFEDGRPYAHCWLEKGNKAMDFRMYNDKKVMVQYTKGEFISILKPSRAIRYTIQECCDLEKRVHGHPGPWHPEIITLCKDVQEQLKC
jgi:hypothetical protein